MVTVLILLAAVGILVWGFIRARPDGKLGLFAWLQSVVLMVPWLAFFGLFTFGIYLNIVWVLALVVVSTGIYIYLGRQLRILAEAAPTQRSTASEPQQPSEPQLADTSAQPEGTESSDHPSGTESSAAGPESDTSAAAPAIPPAIPSEDLEQIEAIFGVDTFFSTETVPYPAGVFFKGNLRGDPDATVKALNAQLENRFGERYRLFLIDGPDERPAMIVLPRDTDPKPANLPQKLVAGGLAIATLITSLETGALLQDFTLFEQPERWLEVFPTALAILAILGVHELGHRWQAQRHQIKLSPPFALPAWQLGAFGTLTRFESVLPNRSVLFDISFAGPAAGGLLSLAMLLVGLILSHPGSFYQLPVEFFQQSVLVGTLARTVLGDTLQTTDLVDIDPLVIMGWLGLVITALNVMPAGRLDGGRIVQAIYGRKTAGRATAVTLVLLTIVALANPLALYWAALILFLQRGQERPCMDDISEPDDARAALALLILFLMLATLLPLTPSLAGRLGIG
ncbi:site-2 protease family protein [Leptolyngbya cf. ectocarpi LEGE 11479]|uniref:Site-2 protease family protein n=1 Tax=Leptolyngbya cf. ectocarpi LEGE 11479 TaxID=1828722 RepID=A0A928ZZ79_LEPEC|nr:site-2 protease family protein [Leptolyngbya ectocarpi]MBE9070185.1 site-2 protease family protein [Leptolyngbya cf. ectocarpi LEGE 11479]